MYFSNSYNKPFPAEHKKPRPLKSTLAATERVSPEVSIITSVEMSRRVIKTDDGNEHELWDHEYWHLCPTKTTWVPTDGRGYALRFAMLLHNAKKAHGLVLAQEDLLAGIEPVSLKVGNAQKAEQLLEEVRKETFPTLPSRLRCHYLNYDKETAEQRAQQWGWDNRCLARCFIIRSGGFFHHADVEIFELLAHDAQNRNLAYQYWQTFHPSSPAEVTRLEVLANSALYFPDWQEFPEVDVEALALWNAHHGGKRRGG